MANIVHLVCSAKFLTMKKTNKIVRSLKCALTVPAAIAIAYWAVVVPVLGWISMSSQKPKWTLYLDKDSKCIIRDRVKKMAVQIKAFNFTAILWDKTSTRKRNNAFRPRSPTVHNFTRFEDRFECNVNALNEESLPAQWTSCPLSSNHCQKSRCHLRPRQTHFHWISNFFIATTTTCHDFACKWHNSMKRTELNGIYLHRKLVQNYKKNK